MTYAEGLVHGFELGKKAGKNGNPKEPYYSQNDYGRGLREGFKQGLMEGKALRNTK